MDHLIGFYRTDPAQKFDRKTQQLLQFIMPHLIEAFRINLLCAIKPRRYDVSGVRAVVNRDGVVLEAEEGFGALMIYLDKLKDHKLALNLQYRSAGKTFKVRGHRIKTRKMGDLISIDVIPDQTGDTFRNQLTERKLQICYYMCQGLTDKEIAKIVELSNNTVSNHIKEIFKCLNVTSRSAAITCLFDEIFGAEQHA